MKVLTKPHDLVFLASFPSSVLSVITQHHDKWPMCSSVQWDGKTSSHSRPLCILLVSHSSGRCLQSLFLTMFSVATLSQEATRTASKLLLFLLCLMFISLMSYSLVQYDLSFHSCQSFFIVLNILFYLFMPKSDYGFQVCFPLTVQSDWL